MYPNSIKNIIDCFKDLPGIGEKTAERLAFSLINFSKEKLTSFSDAIIDVRDKLTNCSICGNITENDICDICSDSNRNSKIVFVVEKAKDISLFEKINIYNVPLMLESQGLSNRTLQACFGTLLHHLLALLPLQHS